MNEGLVVEPRVESVVHQLREYGLEVSLQEPDMPASDFVDQTVILKRGQQQAPFAISADVTGNPTLLGNHRVKPLLIQPHIGVARAAECRRLGLNYVDEAGNAYITFGDVYVDVRGKRSAKQAPARNQVAHHQGAFRLNLFSAKRSRVIFALLTWQDLVRGTVREIS